MKKFNRGDIVASDNQYSDTFGKKGIYLGTYEEKYHIVSFEESGTSTDFVEDEHIQLVAIVKHTPVPIFKKRDIAYLKQERVIILKDRDEHLGYLCFSEEEEEIFMAEEKDLSKEPQKEGENEV
ncbi:MAG: hypothetical protein EOM19_02095 [Candidatus Moranbacteria bacterium]|nr:hypothetical protein [Candidatus Moranbacteria bacterium]